MKKIVFDQKSGELRAKPLGRKATRALEEIINNPSSDMGRPWHIMPSRGYIDADGNDVHSFLKNS